jgi:Protein of unknown function (DUF742)
MSPSQHTAQMEWVDDLAGPVVRPYAMTGGRTRPTRGTFDLITLVVAVRAAYPEQDGLGPEHLTILADCVRPISVAEIAARLGLPVGTVRVLLGDLLDRNLIHVREPRPVAALPDEAVFEAVINGLHAL